jgi:hypothetical protein
MRRNSKKVKSMKSFRFSGQTPADQRGGLSETLAALYAGHGHRVD